MKKWIKWTLIALAIIIATIFFGSIVLFLCSFIFGGLETLFGWIRVAFRWLGNVLDFFGILGLFGG